VRAGFPCSSSGFRARARVGAGPRELPGSPRQPDLDGSRGVLQRSKPRRRRPRRREGTVIPPRLAQVRGFVAPSPSSAPA
jgi:hypothetical protein